MNKLKFLTASLILGALATPAAQAATARVIVGYKSTNAVTTQEATISRVQSLSASSGIKLQAISSPSPKIDVVTAEGISSEELAQKLSQTSNVAYAEPDRLLQAKMAPPVISYMPPPKAMFEDLPFPKLPFQFPRTQWYLEPDHPVSSLSPLTPSGLFAEKAWPYSVGSPDVSIAVLDTGVRLDHEAMEGRFLAGYDFVSKERSNDGDGWDADPSDPGDYSTEEESQKMNGDFYNCPTTSSWHGTGVSGVIAANANSKNVEGIIGLAWNSNILPVRVLGKCGGYESDIIAGMRWSAGLGVPGVAAVPSNTVKILNLSFGSSGTCSNAFRDTIADIRAKGILVVASAGNENGAVSTPGNCPDVITVGAVQSDSAKTSYSNFGPEVTLTAPGGDCPPSAPSNDGNQKFCETDPFSRHTMYSASNAGKTIPAANNYANYWGKISPNKNTLQVQGTSFSAPLTAATLALMWSAHPQLTDTTLLYRLAGSTKQFSNSYFPFLVLPNCPQLGAPNTPEENRCFCTHSTCGAGLLNAENAVAEAMRPVANFTATRANDAAPIVLNGASSTAAKNAEIKSYAWEVLNGNDKTVITAPSASVTNFESAQVGLYQVKLTTTDSTGRVDSKELGVNVTAPTPNAPKPAKSSDGGGGGAADLMLFAGLMLAAGAASRRK